MAEQNERESSETSTVPDATQPHEATIKGIGDAVARLTRIIGLRQCAACKRRQQWLNERLPFPTKLCRGRGDVYCDIWNN